MQCLLNFCIFLLKDSNFFVLIQGLSTGPKNKVLVIGTASLNLAEYASVTEEKDFELEIPLSVPCGAIESPPLLHVRTV